MTTGNLNVGDINVDGFHSAKSWIGTDGRHPAIPNYPGQIKWNSYEMGHVKSSISGPTPCGTGRCNVSRTHPFGTDCADYSALMRGWEFDQIINLLGQQGLAKFNSHWTAQDELKLLAKLLSAVKSHDFNAGVALSEVDKFAKTSVSTLKNIGLGAVDLLYGRYANFARRFGTSPPSRGQVRKLRLVDVPGRFLEMQYCWLPALNDVYQAGEFFNEISKGPRTHTFIVQSKKKVTEVNSGLAPRFPPRDVIVRRKYTYEASEELGFFRQMGLGNPASILWERIPCSFLVDWFIPIGSYLELIGQIPFLKGRFLRTSSLSIKLSGPASISLDPFYTSWVSAGTWRSSAFWLQRDPVASLNVPSPTLKVSGAVQGRRMNNAIALSSLLIERVLNAKPNRRGPGALADSQAIRSLASKLEILTI